MQTKKGNGSTRDETSGEKYFFAEEIIEKSVVDAFFDLGFRGNFGAVGAVAVSGRRERRLQIQ